ncbi:hypothetical protein E3T23_02755 [Cryobacterium cheniae]|uniref:Uncharacterized protein n=1 Tax=Cryobacterium cheniae TaxID=1259262 RepID=A0A4R8XWY9_9MICO|nr:MULTISPECIES: hypothetical protein [Cryobacterium]TFC38976.1 hypothetical protein E3O28_03850 [Cryobacterium sp. TMT2-14]TFC83306.1 hypothetical protein E3T23_02755 [Cryobacterium cheniae]
MTIALVELAPGHPLLIAGWEAVDSGLIVEKRLGGSYQSPRAQLRRMESKAAYENGRRKNQARRFQQVIEVDSLVARGHAKAAALAEIGIDRTAYYEWRSRMREAFGYN